MDWRARRPRDSPKIEDFNGLSPNSDCKTFSLSDPCSLALLGRGNVSFSGVAFRKTNKRVGSDSLSQCHAFWYSTEANGQLGADWRVVCAEGSASVRLAIL